MPNDNQLYFIVEESVTDATIPIEGTRDGRDVGGGWGTETTRGPIEAVTNIFKRKRVPIDAEKLKAQMKDLLAVVNDLFDPAEPNSTVQQANGLQLNEVTLSVEVNAEGELSILGNGGKVGGSGGITLTFTKPKK